MTEVLRHCTTCGRTHLRAAQNDGEGCYVATTLSDATDILADMFPGMHVFKWSCNDPPPHIMRPLTHAEIADMCVG